MSKLLSKVFLLSILGLGLVTNQAQSRAVRHMEVAYDSTLTKSTDEMRSIRAAITRIEEIPDPLSLSVFGCNKPHSRSYSNKIYDLPVTGVSSYDSAELSNSDGDNMGVRRGYLRLYLESAAEKNGPCELYFMYKISAQAFESTEAYFATLNLIGEQLNRNRVFQEYIQTKFESPEELREFMTIESDKKDAGTAEREELNALTFLVLHLDEIWLDKFMSILLAEEGQSQIFFLSVVGGATALAYAAKNAHEIFEFGQGVKFRLKSKASGFLALPLVGIVTDVIKSIYRDYGLEALADYGFKKALSSGASGIKKAGSLVGASAKKLIYPSSFQGWRAGQRAVAPIGVAGTSQSGDILSQESLRPEFTGQFEEPSESKLRQAAAISLDFTTNRMIDVSHQLIPNSPLNYLGMGTPPVVENLDDFVSSRDFKTGLLGFVGSVIGERLGEGAIDWRIGGGTFEVRAWIKKALQSIVNKLPFGDKSHQLIDKIQIRGAQTQPAHSGLLSRFMAPRALLAMGSGMAMGFSLSYLYEVHLNESEKKEKDERVESARIQLLNSLRGSPQGLVDSLQSLQSAVRERALFSGLTLLDDLASLSMYHQSRHICEFHRAIPLLYAKTDNVSLRWPEVTPEGFINGEKIRRDIDRFLETSGPEFKKIAEKMLPDFQLIFEISEKIRQEEIWYVRHDTNTNSVLTEEFEINQYPSEQYYETGLYRLLEHHQNQLGRMIHYNKLLANNRYHYNQIVSQIVSEVNTLIDDLNQGRFDVLRMQNQMFGCGELTEVIPALDDPKLTDSSPGEFVSVTAQPTAHPKGSVMIEVKNSTDPDGPSDSQFFVPQVWLKWETSQQFDIDSLLTIERRNPMHMRSGTGPYEKVKALEWAEKRLDSGLNTFPGDLHGVVSSGEPYGHLGLGQMLSGNYLQIDPLKPLESVKDIDSRLFLGIYGEASEPIPTRLEDFETEIGENCDNRPVYYGSTFGQFQLDTLSCHSNREVRRTFLFKKRTNTTEAAEGPEPESRDSGTSDYELLSSSYSTYHRQRGGLEQMYVFNHNSSERGSPARHTRSVLTLQRRLTRPLNLYQKIIYPPQ